MQIDIDTLPTEVESLREIIAVLNNKNYLLFDECNKLSNQNTKLSTENTELLDRIIPITLNKLYCRGDLIV